MNQTLLPNAQKIAFIQANWHADIVAEARKSFIKNVEPAGIAEKDIEIIDVPGSLWWYLSP